jgi:hypothetical protein
MKPLVAAARTEEELVPKVRDARARIAFYASTPGYAKAFEHLGLGDLAAAAKEHSKAQRWEELPRMIDDEVLHQFVVAGTYDTIGAQLLERHGDLVTDIEFSIAVRTEQDRRPCATSRRCCSRRTAPKPAPPSPAPDAPGVRRLPGCFCGSCQKAHTDWSNVLYSATAAESSPPAGPAPPRHYRDQQNPSRMTHSAGRT